MGAGLMPLSILVAVANPPDRSGNESHRPGHAGARPTRVRSKRRGDGRETPRSVLRLAHSPVRSAPPGEAGTASSRRAASAVREVAAAVPAHARSQLAYAEATE